MWFGISFLFLRSGDFLGDFVIVCSESCENEEHYTDIEISRILIRAEVFQHGFLCDHFIILFRHFLRDRSSETFFIFILEMRKPFITILPASQIDNHQGGEEQIIDKVDLHRCIVEAWHHFLPGKGLMVHLLAVHNAFALFDFVVLGFEEAEHFLVEQDVGVLGRR